MNEPLGPLLPHQAMRRLAEFLAGSDCPLTAGEAASEAVDQWLAAKSGHLIERVVALDRGYRWKTLFLPQGTRLRMHCGGRSYDATIEGDELIFEGRAMSPRQMTLSVAGKGYNAWRALWVLLPGAMRWRPAAALRREAAREAPQTMSPYEAMNAAADCMSRTLQTALALVDHAKAQALPAFERRSRAQPRRRASDALEDISLQD
jgi:hypothetical protein